MQTIENTRERDVTMIAPEDAEVEADDDQDEFASALLSAPPSSTLPVIAPALLAACMQGCMPIGTDGPINNTAAL